MAKRKKQKGRSKPSGKKLDWKTALQKRRHLIKFWLSFAGVLVVFYAIVVQPFYVENVQQPVSSFFANVASGLLNIFGQDTTAEGMDILSEKYSLSIKKGCDSIAPLMLTIAGMLLFPVSWKKRWAGIGLAILALFNLNLIRIVSLYFIGVHAPGWFEFMHIEFWQVVFIGLTILFFFTWLNWATKDSHHASAA